MCICGGNLKLFSLLTWPLLPTKHKPTNKSVDQNIARLLYKQNVFCVFIDCPVIINPNRGWYSWHMTSNHHSSS